ncbi:ATP-binding protein [Novosphingobium pentaromativorans]|nr:ATP-binding protein [Novosphingobium pentaromativorans]
MLRWLLGWFDSLRGRIAIALLIGLTVQFIGSDIIFERIEAARLERARAQRLADWLSFADEFAGTRPDAFERMTKLWQPDLIVRRSLAAVPEGGVRSDGEARQVRQLILEARPQLRHHDVRATAEGRDLVGSMHLANGDWLVFRAEDYFTFSSQLQRFAVSGFLLLLCVTFIVLLFGRMVGRPLARIAKAASRVGWDEAVPVDVNGPREVRQVAIAFGRMQSRLMEQVADRMQSMAAMSHDLRTPLARMRLNISAVGDAEARAAFEQDVEEMEGFVSSILDYLRGDEAEAEQRVDVASIVMTVVDEARDRSENAIYAGPDRLEAVTRPLKLKRLVRNIVQNATRHADNACVTLTQGKHDIHIVVTDEGQGIPDTDLELVFEPFRRLENARKRHIGGSGLGLTSARRLVERLGGTITLANRPQSCGLEVTIRLPLVKV